MNNRILILQTLPDLARWAATLNWQPRPHSDAEHRSGGPGRTASSTPAPSRIDSSSSFSSLFLDALFVRRYLHMFHCLNHCVLLIPLLCALSCVPNQVWSTTACFDRGKNEDQSERARVCVRARSIACAPRSPRPILLPPSIPKRSPLLVRFDHFGCT